MKRTTLIIVLALISSFCEIKSSLSMHREVMNSLETKPVEEMFKLWHYFMQRSYDFNSKEGKRRFTIFKENMDKIKQINSEKLGFTLGLGYFSDYHVSELESPFRSNDDIFNQNPTFDDLADEDDLAGSTENELNNLKDEYSTPDWINQFEGKFPAVNPTIWNGRICGNHTLSVVFATLFDLYAKITEEISDYQKVSPMFFRQNANLNKNKEDCSYTAAPERFIFDISSLPTEEELPWRDEYYISKKPINFAYDARVDLCVYPFYNCSDELLKSRLNVSPYASRLAYTFDIIHYQSGIIDSSRCAERSADNGVLVLKMTDKFVEVLLPLPVKASSSGLALSYSSEPFIVKISQDLNGHPKKSCGLRSAAYFVQMFDRK